MARDLSTTRPPLETLRELVHGTPPITQEYLNQLAQVLGRQDYATSPANRMATYGFYWSITLENLLKGFRYAAGLSGQIPELLVGKKDKFGRLTKGILFTGFIPTFAVRKIIQAQEAGLHKFTIHSSQPLPTEEVMAKRDPVVIGWEDYPFIELGENEVLKTEMPNLRGFFVTGWDLENEFLLPPPV